MMKLSSRSPPRGAASSRNDRWAALAIEPTVPTRWSPGKHTESKHRPIKWRHKLLAARASYMASIKYQMRAASLGRMTNPNVWPLAFSIERLDVNRRSKQYRKWTAARSS